MDPEWKGVAWAPVTGALAKRRVLGRRGSAEGSVLPVRPHRALHRQGDVQGAWNRKFSWQGELLNTLQVMGGGLPKAFTRPDGKVDYLGATNMAFQCAENIKVNQATVAGIKSDPKGGFDIRVPLAPNLFDVSSLSRFGK